MNILPLLPPDSCDSCGLCCQGIGSPILIYASRPGLPEPHPFRPAGMPQDLIEEIDQNFAGLLRGQEPQDRCLWYDPVTFQCRHYDLRPQVCRDYELAGRACLQRRRDEWKKSTAYTPPESQFKTRLLTDSGQPIDQTENPGDSATSAL